MAKKLDQEALENIRLAFINGEKNKAIAEFYNITQGRVSQLRLQMGFRNTRRTENYQQEVLGAQI